MAYQQPVIVQFKTGAPTELLANTFEDALVYENLAIFKGMKGAGLLGRFREAIEESTDTADLAKRVFDGLAKGGKAEFAMELLYSTEIDAMTVPAYIDKGLAWLADQLKRKEDDVLGKGTITLVPVPASDATQGNAPVTA